MNAIGSLVVYGGKTWINAFYGIQPVWGVQEFPGDDVKEKTEKVKNKKTFSQVLLETMNKPGAHQNQETDLVHKTSSLLNEAEDHDEPSDREKAIINLKRAQYIIDRLVDGTDKKGDS